MRPAHAKPNVVARVASAWPDGDQDVPHKPDLAGTLGLETNRAPLPPAAVCRACIAGPCTSVPRLLFKYALQARRARLSLQPFSPSELTALPRCLVLFGLELCHTQRLLSALSPLLPHILVVSVSLQEPEPSSYACMRAAALRSSSPVYQQHSTAHMPVRPPAQLSI